jgi:hypothetical protein
MKDCPLSVVGPLGPWYRKVNDLLAQMVIGDKRQHVCAVLGEPDFIVTPNTPIDEYWQARGAYLHFGHTKPDELLVYSDPYRPNYSYHFEILDGLVAQKYRNCESIATAQDDATYTPPSTRVTNQYVPITAMPTDPMRTTRR